MEQFLDARLLLNLESLKEQSLHGATYVAMSLIYTLMILVKIYAVVCDYLVTTASYSYQLANNSLKKLICTKLQHA